MVCTYFTPETISQFKSKILKVKKPPPPHSPLLTPHPLYIVATDDSGRRTLSRYGIASPTLQGCIQLGYSHSARGYFYC